MRLSVRRAVGIAVVAVLVPLASLAAPPLAATYASPPSDGANARSDTARGSAAHEPRGGPSGAADPEVITADAELEARREARHLGRSGPRGRPRVSTLPDAAALPPVDRPSMQREDPTTRGALLGWSALLDASPRADQIRRPPFHDEQSMWGLSLRPGERFEFEIYFSGSLAGTAVASVVERTRDARGGPPSGTEIVKLNGKATTSGVIAMFATLVDEMDSWVDGRTGASMLNRNRVERGGIMAPYKRRETTTEYFGRGQVRIRDVRDTASNATSRRVPRDTLDPLAAMAWLRFLDLAPGERASAHTLDVASILRIEAVGRGHSLPDDMPSIVAGLGVDKARVKMIEGTLTPVDRYDQPIPGRKSFSFRVWFSGDGRGLPLVLESDLWMGVIRLQLSSYDPPR